jgi:hypothetical protein
MVLSLALYLHTAELLLQDLHFLVTFIGLCRLQINPQFVYLFVILPCIIKKYKGKF